MMKLSDLEVDVRAEDEGDWVEIPGYPGFAILSRSIHCAAYRDMNKGLLAKLRRRLGNKKMLNGEGADEEDELNKLCVLETCLQGWRGLEDDDGKEIPFSGDLARTLMTERAHRKFQNAAVYAAVTVGDRELELEQADEKNSPTPSAGKAAGEGRKASSKKSESASEGSPAP